jgi:hypothetical protein
MKPTKIFSALLIGAAAVWTWVACEDDFQHQDWVLSTVAHYLTPAKTSISRTQPDAFTEKIGITSMNVPWKFTDVPSWLALSPMSGTGTASVEMSVEENTWAEGRTGIFYLSPSQTTPMVSSKAVSVTQGAAKAWVSVDQAEISLPGVGATSTVNVTANCTWVASSSAEWLTLTVTDSQIQMVATDNSTDNYRSAGITIKYSGGTEWISVKQWPANISTSAASIAFDDAALQFTLDVTSEMAWTSTTSATWINVTPDHGPAGTTSVVVEVAPNTTTSARSGSVAILTGSTQRQLIKITQKGLFLNVGTLSSTSSYNHLSYTAFGGSEKLQVTTNGNWVVESKPNWITVSATQGYGNAELTVNAEDNPNRASRTGTINVRIPGLNVQRSVTVTQEGKTLLFGSTLLEFDAMAASRQLNITGNATWSTILSDTWFSATPLSGQGAATVTVSVEENSSVNERNGSLTYTCGSDASSVNIHQAGKYFTIDNAGFEFTSVGGTHLIDFTTNERWTATVEHGAEWLWLSQTAGEGSAQITLTVSDNPTVYSRSTYIVLQPECAEAVRITVSQKPRKLEVNTSSVLFYAKGGTSDPITVETDGTFAVYSDESWITTTCSGNTFTVSVPSYTGFSARQGTVCVGLSDLKEGSLELAIPVLQTGQGGSFVLNDYSQDGNWNVFSNDSLSLTIKRYTTDVNWNSSGTYTATFQVQGYTTEHDWNSKESGANSVTIKPYGTDASWCNTSGSMTVSSYGSESAWGNSNGSVTITTYAADSLWGNSVGHVWVLPYGADTLWGDRPIVIAGDSIFVHPYGSETLWGNSNLTTTLSGYGSDTVWGQEKQQIDTLSISSYGTDANWDGSARQDTFGVTITPYGRDSLWGNSTGTIAITPYGTDSVWGNETQRIDTLSLTPYGPDTIWGNSSGGIQSSTYPTDANWDAAPEGKSRARRTGKQQ